MIKNTYLLHCFSFLCLLLFFSTSKAEQLIIEPDMGRAPILSAMYNAKNTIDLVMYGFTDTQLMQALVTAKKSGKDIHVLLQKYPYKNDQENLLAIQTLQTGNISLKWPNPDYKLTHQKTLIIDHHKALVLTFNFTNSSFKNERNFGLIIDDPAMVNEIQQIFNADWNYKNIIVENPNLIWSPNNSREKLLNFIRQAKSNIDIYAQSITDYKMIGALAEAARHGIKITILTSIKPAGKNKKYDYLTRAGVTIHYSHHYYIHAKVIIIDHRTAMLGSMNLTNASIDGNRELSVITENKAIINTLENTFLLDNQDSETMATTKSSRRYTTQTTKINYTKLVRFVNDVLK